VRAGNRDRSRRRPPLAEAAPLDGDDRTLARLGSLIVPAGIAIGRAVRLSGPAIVVGLVVLFMGLGPWWLWNDRSVYTTALMQVQPLDFPDRYVVHLPTAALHDLYLLGLVALFSGLALRAAPRARLVGGGALIAVFAVVGQLLVSPF